MARTKQMPTKSAFRADRFTTRGALLKKVNLSSAAAKAQRDRDNYIRGLNKDNDPPDSSTLVKMNEVAKMRSALQKQRLVSNRMYIYSITFNTKSLYLWSLIVSGSRSQKWSRRKESTVRTKAPQVQARHGSTA
jgi:hypothetical protein